MRQSRPRTWGKRSKKTMPPLLEVRDLHVSYGRLPALQGVDVVVPEGALVAMLGPNGAGKSTLLKCIAGLVSSKRGSITLAGRRIDKLSAHDRAKRGVCLIPEGRGIFPTLSVAENLHLALDGGGGEAPAPAYEHFPRLPDRRSHRPGTPSGGRTR